MFNNIGIKIKITATVLTIIVLGLIIICTLAGGILFLTGRTQELQLKIMVMCVAGGIMVYILSMLLFAFGHLIDMQEEQTELLRKIAEDELSGYGRTNNNVFIE